MSETRPVHVHHVYALDRLAPKDAEFGNFGFGAFVRGTAALWYAVQGLSNCTLDVCFRGHPTLKTLLKSGACDDCAAVKGLEAIQYVDGTSIARLRQHIRRMRAAGQSTIFMSTDAAPDNWPEKLDPACASWLREQIVPAEELDLAIVAALGARPDRSYEVLHVRCAHPTDSSESPSLTSVERFVLEQFIKTCVRRDGAPEIVMLSDDANLCEEIAPQHGFTMVTGAKPLHLGTLNQQEALEDATFTMVQFFMMGHAACIWQASILSFGTAFSDAAGLMYDVPVKRCIPISFTFDSTYGKIQNS